MTQLTSYSHYSRIHFKMNGTAVIWCDTRSHLQHVQLHHKHKLPVQSVSLQVRARQPGRWVEYLLLVFACQKDSYELGLSASQVVRLICLLLVFASQ